MSNPTGVVWLPQPPPQICLHDSDLGRVGATEQPDGSYMLKPNATAKPLLITKHGSQWDYNGTKYGHIRAALWAALNQWKAENQ
jgi:hypothetical protein